MSLLKILAESHPESIAPLTYQYRMHNDICELSSRFVYDGKMRCGNDKVARTTLHLPDFLDGNHLCLSFSAWRKSAVDPSLPVVFLNTDTVCLDKHADLESSSGKARGGPIINETEVQVVRQVVDDLISCGLPPSSIGVISPFRAQVCLSGAVLDHVVLEVAYFIFSFSCIDFRKTMPSQNIAVTD